MSEIAIQSISEDALSATVASPAAAAELAARLRATGCFADVTPGMDSVAIVFDPLTIDHSEARGLLAEAAAHSLPASWPEGRLVEIEARFGGDDGPDLDRLAHAGSLSPSAYLDRIFTASIRVELTGFLPGFAYASGLPPELEATRLATPRTQVAAGSIGVCDLNIGLYAVASPGGWPLIGRATTPLFDPTADDPFRLRAGDQLILRPAR